MRNIAEVFAEVEKGNADFGVAPVENSTEGVVSHTLDMFVDSPLLICGEVVVEAALHLLSKAPTLAEVRKIYSHPHGLAESRKWLERNVAQVPVVETSSTGAAAEIAASEPGAGGLALRPHRPAPADRGPPQQLDPLPGGWEEERPPDRRG